jgi:hypothetical protein
VRGHLQGFDGSIVSLGEASVQESRADPLFGMMWHGSAMAPVRTTGGLVGGDETIRTAPDALRPRYEALDAYVQAQRGGSE